MNINMVVKRYASGEINRVELETLYRNIGYSEQIIEILMRAADYRRKTFIAEEQAGRNSSQFYAPYEECVTASKSPSGSLGGDGKVWELSELSNLVFLVQNPNRIDGWEEIKGSSLNGGK